MRASRKSDICSYEVSKEVLLIRSSGLEHARQQEEDPHHVSLRLYKVDCTSQGSQAELSLHL